MDSIFLIVIVIISIMFHELAHGTVASYLGDDTAMKAGRLTLNPLAHLEWVGSFFVPLLCVISGSGMVIGWAKPVPVNGKNLRYGAWGNAMVAVAGPLANLLIAGGCAIGFHLLLGTAPFVASFLALVVMVNVSLMVFNLIPLPPLDGHHILGALFPAYQAWSNRIMSRFGLIAMLIVIFVAGSVIGPVVSFVARLFLGL